MGQRQPPPPLIPSDLVPNALISALGDSLTNNMGPWPDQTEVSWLMRGCYASGGKLRPYAPYGIPGATSATILSTGLPAILALNPRPAYCVVLAGTNDAGQAVPIATTMANLIAIWTTLRAYGITPILATPPPRNAVGANTFVIREATKLIAAFVATYAAQHNLPLFDFHSAMIDSTSSTGSPVSGTTVSDGVHLTPAGAILGGSALGTLISTLNPYGAPRLALDNSDTSLSVFNPLFLTDTNSDGLPDRWNNVNTGGFGTTTLVSGGADAVGNWMRFEKTTGTDLSSIRTNTFSIAPGDRISFSGRLQISTMDTNARAIVAIGDGSSSSKMFLNAVSYVHGNWGPLTFVVEGIVPSNLGLSSTAAVWVGINSGPGVIQLAQSTLRNLTQLGLA